MDPTSLAIAYDFLKKIGGILKLRKREDQKALKESEILQKNLFGKNLIIINLGSSNEPLITTPEKIPDEVFERIEKQFRKRKINPDNESVRLISSGFKERMNDYKKHFSRKFSDIEFLSPFIDEWYKSIFKLSNYVGSLLSQEKHDEARTARNDIEKQYGKAGRKLCNLYLTGYLQKLINFVKSEKLDTYADKEELSRFITRIIKDMVEDTNIFFIKENDNIVRVATKIVNLMEAGHAYIAIHSAGSWNIRKAKKIIKIVEDDIEKYGYRKKVDNKPMKSSKCPIFYVRIIREG